MCISLLNHADRVKAACLAQLVNAIAPIMTETGGPAWRQTIFFPFAQFSHFGRGTVLRSEVECARYDASYYDPRGAQDLYFPVSAPYLKMAAVRDDVSGGVTIFALNRHLTEPLQLKVDLDGLGLKSVRAARQLCDQSLAAKNTATDPERIRPGLLSGATLSAHVLRATLAPASWNMIRLGTTA